MPTIRDICEDALTEIRVVGSGSAMSAEDAALAKRKLQSMLNQWNAQRPAVYADVFAAFTLVPSLSPHTIGPTGATFTVTQRPVSIEAISLGINTSNPTVYLPLNKRDAAWWEAQSVPDLTSDIPTDFFYNPTWPNGSIYFWPVPTAAYPVQLQIRLVLDDVLAFNDDFDLPPGYEEAITLSLAEQLARPFGQPLSADLRQDAAMARAVIFANNDVTPRIATRDAGMQIGNGGMRPTFNYLLGVDTFNG